MTTTMEAVTNRIEVGVPALWLEAAVEQLRHLPGGATADELETAMCRIGRNYAPALLFDYANEVLGWRQMEQVHRVAHSAWSDSEYPEDSMDGDELWSILFGGYGTTFYRVDGKRRKRPTAVSLYRGCPESRVGRMAWTGSLEIARSFAQDALRGREVGKVWTVEAPGSALLGYTGDRSEDEYILHPRHARRLASDAVEVQL